METSTSPPADPLAATGEPPGPARRARPSGLLIAAGCCALAIAVFALSHTALWRARAIRVSGGSHLSRAQVLRIAGISGHTNVVWLDEGLAERRLEATAWVAEARVQVELPSTVTVTVTERTPVAVATDGALRILVAGDGAWLETGASPRGLPVIRFVRQRLIGGPAPGPEGAALALGAMDPTLRVRVTRVDVHVDGALDVRLRGGTLVRFGTQDRASQKSAVIQRALSWASSQGYRLRVLSVMAPTSPAATLT